MKNKKKILEALLACPTVRAAAKVCGVSEMTVYRYLKDPEFKAEYEELKRQTFDEAINFLKSRMSKAVQQLDNLIDNPTVHPRINMESAMFVATTAIDVDDRQNLQDYIAELKEHIAELENARK
jgi:AcrR family transcriptional regulator